PAYNGLHLRTGHRCETGRSRGGRRQDHHEENVHRRRRGQYRALCRSERQHVWSLGSRKVRSALISHVKFVTIPTRDQEKALAFYTEKLGFKVVTNQPFDQKQRWIEMRIGRSDTHFVLFNGDESKTGGFFNGAL